MSIFDLPGVYARHPQGGVKHVQELLDAGFRWYAFNLHDHPVPEWSEVIALCRSVEMPVFPWFFVRTDEEVASLCELARQQFDGQVIVNAEKPLDLGQVTMDAILRETQGLDAALSTEPWLYDSIEWSEFPGPIQLQLFPQENETSKDPRGCRTHAYARGARRADFMLGMHGRPPAEFPYRQYGYSVYTVDDMGPNCDVWGPENPMPLHAGEFPKVAPGYGPNSASKPQSKKSKAWRALKRAMHNAGFGDFPNPDDAYNAQLSAAMRSFQVVAGISPSGDYGSASYEALRTLAAVTPTSGGAYAMDEQSRAWTREAKAAGDPK